MRVIAGRLGGRRFNSPAGHRTHPMSDKARGAVFNALGDVDGLTVLDAFAGTGALSFEAISRGAKKATAIDSDRNAQITIAANIKELQLTNQVKLIKASANAWLSTSDQQFDLVLLDPPYNDLQTNLLINLAGRAKPGGVVVLSLPPGITVSLSPDFEPLAAKTYGDNQLIFFRRIK
jgi:16S rRNA (guanine966-N2)-methyltransferase